MRTILMLLLSGAAPSAFAQDYVSGAPTNPSDTPNPYGRMVQETRTGRLRSVYGIRNMVRQAEGVGSSAPFSVPRCGYTAYQYRRPVLRLCSKRSTRIFLTATKRTLRHWQTSIPTFMGRELDHRLRSRRCLSTTIRDRCQPISS